MSDPEGAPFSRIAPPAIFVDRDGTINAEKGHVFRLEDFEYLPGALEALKMASDRGLAIFIVTNQAGIAKGLYSEQQFLSLTNAMMEQMAAQGVRIRNVLYCPHHPQATVPRYRAICDCRKPASGLLRGVMESGGFDAPSSAMIGDKNSDIEAGQALGLRTYLVETGYGSSEKTTTRADHVVADLRAAMVHLLSSPTRRT